MSVFVQLRGYMYMNKSCSPPGPYRMGKEQKKKKRVPFHIGVGAGGGFTHSF